MSSLKRNSITIRCPVYSELAVSASAQVVVPRPSQKASVMQRIGATDVTITYSRPGVKGRKIWGDPLPEQTASVKVRRRSTIKINVPKRRHRSVWTHGAHRRG